MGVWVDVKRNIDKDGLVDSNIVSIPNSLNPC